MSASNIAELRREILESERQMRTYDADFKRKMPEVEGLKQKLAREEQELIEIKRKLDEVKRRRLELKRELESMQRDLRSAA